MFQNFTQFVLKSAKSCFFFHFPTHEYNKKMLGRTFFGCSKTLRKCLSTLLMKELKNGNPPELISEKQKVEIKHVLEHPDYFNVHDMFTIRDLFDARVHYGHKVTSLNRRMLPFIFGTRLNHIIFDLNITAVHLKKALNFAAHIAFQSGIILFVSKNSSITLLVERTALECKEYALTRQWRNGVFTDFKNSFKILARLPDLCVVLNTLEENGSQHPAIVECAKMFIPTIGIVDSNCDPNLVTYPVPGSDDSIPTITFYCNLFKEAILRGKNKRKELENLESRETETKETAAEKVHVG